MKFLRDRQLLAWLPQLDPQVWILVVGRLLSQTGTGFTLFYAPIFFVNQVGLSATLVGIGLGSASISGVVGRIASGFLCDWSAWGRKRTLMLSALISAAGSFTLAATNDFTTLVVGNLLAGLGIGLYWPATETVVADLTTPQQRREAYAFTRLGDSLGLGVGIVLGGIVIDTVGAYRALFVVDGTSFLVFLSVIGIAIAETRHQVSESEETTGSGWITVLRDRPFLVYILVNIIFTTYLSQIHTSIPLYFSNFIDANQGEGFSGSTISGLFTWHIALSVALQLPVARWLNRFSHTRALMVSAIAWALGFIVIWQVGVASGEYLAWAALGLGILAIATVAYTPSASALVAEMAPVSRRGIYLSMNSLCWAAGYFIGPPMGGWAIDLGVPVAYRYWLGVAASTIVAIAILSDLERQLQSRKPQDEIH